MKIRRGFVSNSSSSSFVLRNISGEDRTLLDFVNENKHLVTDFVKEYGYGDPKYDPTLKEVRKNAKTRGDVYPAGFDDIVTFGDEDGDDLGKVFDYMLRDGGTSKSFDWDFHEYLR